MILKLRSAARRKSWGATTEQRLFYVRRRSGGSFEWYVLNGHSRRRARKTFKTKAAAEACGRSCRLTSTAIRGCEAMRHDRPAAPARAGTWP